MMVDVVRAKCSPRQPLQKIAFLVRRAVRADKADSLRSIRGMQFLQFSRSGLRSFFPGNRQQFVALADERLLDALRVLREIEAEAALYAQKFLVNAREVAIVGAQDFVVAHAQRGLAAVRTMGANRRDVLHLPRPRFV